MYERFKLNHVIIFKFTNLFQNAVTDRDMYQNYKKGMLRHKKIERITIFLFKVHTEVAVAIYMMDG